MNDATRRLTGDRRLLRNSAAWAAANWLFDAAALWCFVATLGVLGWRLVNYWLSLPTGAIAYLTLQRRRRRHDQDASRRAPGNGEVPRDTGCRGG